MPDFSRLDAVLRATEGSLPGVVAMATSGAATLYEGAAGTRDAAGRVRMTTDTIFSLASMTKAVVSIAALQLVDQGRLDLDVAIADVLPELADPRVLDGVDRDGRARTRPAARPVTLRHLLSHSSGYGYDAVNPELARFLHENGLPAVPDSAADLARIPLLFDPGTDWNYGISTDIVGRAIEAVSGQRLDRQMGAGILAELGMADSGFVLTDAQRARLVTTHARGGDGGLTDLGFPFDRPARFFMGGGGMHATAGDYLRFIRLILNDGMHDGTRLLSPAAMDAIRRNQLAPGVAVRRMRSSNPAVANDAEFFPGMTKHWSAAFMINTETAPTGRNPGSLAWAGVVNTYCWIDPAAGIGGVFLTQLLPFYDQPALDAFAAFERAVYDLAG
jgi:CubicO group peptidase (beta-lactamase class C family)